MESVVASVLNALLGQYVDGLNNLNLSVTSGDIVLENLAIKKEALQDLKLPIYVKSGFLGKLRINIPWSNLKHMPTVISLERIFLIIGAKTISTYDPDLEEKQAQFTKQKRLYLNEIFRSDKAPAPEVPSKAKQTTTSFTDKLVAKIVERLQVTVKHIHIRYEDETVPKHPFAWGITIDSVTAMSTTGTDGGGSLIEKLVSLNYLAVYWNVDSPPLKFSSQKELGEQLDSLIFTNINSPPHQYLLDPVCGTLKITINQLEADLSRPKITLDFLFDRVAILLRRPQYLTLLDTVQHLMDYHRKERFLRFRPTVPPKYAPREWWMYAARAHMFLCAERRRTWSWAYMSSRRKDRTTYVELWKRKKLAEITPQETAQLETLDRVLSYEDIVLYRSLGDALAHKHVQATLKSRTGNSWLSNLISSVTGAPKPPPGPALALSSSQWRELYTAIDYSETAAQVVDLPKEYIKMQLRGTLEKGSLQLADDKGRLITDISFEQFKVGFQRRADSATVVGSLQALRIRDLFDQNSRFPSLLMVDDERPAPSDVSLVAFHFEQNPISGAADYELHVDLLQHIKLVVSRAFIECLADFFTATKQRGLEDLMQAASQTVKNLREETLFQIRHALFSRKTLALHVVAESPTLLIPKCCNVDNEPMVVIKVDRLALTADPQHMKNLGEVELELRSNDVDFFYHTFHVALKGTYGAITTVGREVVARDVGGRSVLLANFDFGLEVKICNQKSSDLPSVKVALSLPTLNINGSSELLIALMDTLKEVIAGPDKEWEVKAKLAAARARQQARANVMAKLFKRKGMLNSTSAAGSNVPEAYERLTSRQKAFLEKPLVSILFQAPDIRIDWQHAGRRVVSLYARSVEVRAVKKEFKFSFDLTIGSLVLEDAVVPNAQNLASTTAEGPLRNPLLIHYQYVSEISPDYAELDHELDISLRKLYVAGQLETMIQVRAAVNVLVAHFSGKKVKANSPQAILDAERDANMSIAKVSMRVRSLEASVECGAAKVAHTVCSDITALANVHPSWYHLSGTVGRIQVRDVSTDGSSVWTRIVDTRVTDESVLSFTYEHYDTTLATFPGYDGYVKLVVNPTRVVFLQRFVSEMLNFLSALLANKDDAPKEPDTKMRLDIQLLDQCVLVPQSSESSDTLWLDVSAVNIQNTFFVNLENDQHFTNSIKVNLLGLSLRTIDSSTQIFHQRIVTDLSVEVGVELNTLLSQPEFRLVLRLPGLHTKLTETQLLLLFGIVEQNLCEAPEVCPNPEKPPEKPASTKRILRQIEVDIAPLSLEFLNNEGVDANPAPLFTMSFARVAGVFRMVGDASMAGDFDLRDWTILDTRAKTPCVWRRLLFPPKKDELRTVHIEYRRTPTLDQSVVVAVPAMRSHLTFPLLMNVYQFLINYVMEMVRVIGLWNQYRDPSPDDGPHPFTVKMSIDQIFATLVADLASPTSPVISTTAKCALDLTTFDGRTELAVRLSEWEFNRTRPGQAQTEDVCIIEPCSFLYTLQSHAGKETNMGVVVDALEMAMTYQDVVVFGKACRSAFWPSPASVCPPLLLNDDGPLPQRTLLVELRKLMFLLIDDRHGSEQPFGIAAVTDLQADLSDWGHPQSRGGVQATLTVDYYNRLLEVWEPVIESCEALKLQFRSTEEETETVVEVQEPLEVTVSETFLRRVLEYYRHVSTDSTPGGERVSSGTDELRSHPFIITNETGRPVKYWLAGGRMRTLRDATPKALRLSDLQATAGERLEQSMISLWPMQDYPAVRNLPVARAGTYVLSLNPLLKNHCFTYEVSFHRGNKLLRVRSSTMVENNTAHPVDVRMTNKAGAATVLEALAPHSRVPLPLDIAWEGKIAFRPTVAINGVEFGFSDQAMNCAELSAQWGRLMCQPTHSAGYGHVYAVEVEATPTESGEGSETLIRLHAPLTVVNVLPYDIDFQVWTLRENKAAPLDRIAEYAARATQRVEAHQLVEAERLGLCLSTRQFHLSTVVSVNQTDATLTFELNSAQPGIAPLTLHGHVEANGPLIRIVHVYARYWLVNRTGLYMAAHDTKHEHVIGQHFPVQFKLVGEPREWYTRDPERSRPLLYGHTAEDPRLCFKIAESQWSKARSVSSLGPTAQLEVADGRAHNGTDVRQFVLAVTVQNCDGAFWRTKQITLLPRFVLYNKLAVTLLYRQEGTSTIHTLLPDEHLPFHWHSSAAPHLLRAGLEDGWNWSGAFKIAEIASFPLKLRHVQHTGDSTQIRVHIRVDPDTLVMLVAFSPENMAFPMCRVENNCRKPLMVMQQGQALPDIVPADSSVPFVWDDPNTEKPRMLIGFAGMKSNFYVLNIDKFGVHGSVEIVDPADNKKEELRIETLADGPTKVVRVEELAAFKARMAAGDMGEGRHRKRDATAPRRTRYGLRVERAAVSLVDDTPQEWSRVILRGLMTEYVDTTTELQFEVVLADMQVDNQLTNTPHPVVFSTNLPTPTGATSKLPFLRLSLIIDSGIHRSIKYFRYFAVLAQEMDIRIDEAFLVQLLRTMEIYRTIMQPADDKPANQITVFDFQLPELLEQFSADMIYFEMLIINPMKIRVSFASVPGVDKTSLRRYAAVAQLCDTAGSITNVDFAPIALNGLMLKNPFCSQQELVGRISEHYRTALLRGLFKILGSADILGSPVSFISNMGTGVYDFFHEPALGLVSSPQDFGRGIKKGTKSLVSASVYAAFNSGSKITNAVSGGLTHMAGDPTFLKQREAVLRERPKGVGEGFTSGAKHLGRAVVAGFAGVVREPLEGQKKKGLGGFLMGIQRGVQGIYLTPAIGVLDLMTKTGEGIRNATDMAENMHRVRDRPPRYFGPDRVMLPYSAARSAGQELLRQAEHGRFLSDYYITHYELYDGAILLVSHQHLLFFTAGPKTSLQWCEPLSRITAIEGADDCVVLQLRSVATQLRAPSANPSRVIMTGTQQAMEIYNWLMEQIKQLKLLYTNALVDRTRMM